MIESELKRFCDELRVNLVVTTGGTGVGPRDNTPDATKNIIQRELTGVGETLRSYGQQKDTLHLCFLEEYLELERGR